MSNPRVAIALSNQTCAIYDVGRLTKVETLCGHKGTVVNIRYGKYWKNKKKNSNKGHFFLSFILGRLHLEYFYFVLYCYI